MTDGKDYINSFIKKTAKSVQVTNVKEYTFPFSPKFRRLERKPKVQKLISFSTNILNQFCTKPEPDREEQFAQWNNLLDVR